MKRPVAPLVPSILLATLFSLAWTGNGLSQSFQVTISNSSLSAAGEARGAHHLVLFHDGKIYDFELTAPRDVMVIDPANGRLTLISRARNVQCNLASGKVMEDVATIRVFVENSGKEDKYGLEAKPEKYTSDDSDATVNGYKIAYAGYRYNVKAAKPEDRQQPVKFVEFTDWVTRLNLIRGMGPPPFARMTLGRTIALDGNVPEEITLQLPGAGGNRSMKSKFEFKNGLTPEAKHRIDEIAEWLKVYPQVRLDDFPR